jgi:2-methylcitrate dehydratase PrpD
MQVSNVLARHLSGVCFNDLPRQVVTSTKHSILDAIGVTLAAGSLSEECRPFLNLVLREGGRPESTILGFGAKVPASQAAFVNGAMAHALDFEDGHDAALVHPHAPTIPAALAVAESLRGVCGRDLITAVALGSDLVCRLALALKVNLLEYGWYLPPIVSAFGAAAAAGKLLNLSPDQMLDAISLVMCQATCSGELTRNSQSVIRSVRDAFAARAGVTAAFLAKDGVTGFRQPLEGDRGFFQAYARGKYNPVVLLERVGHVFEGANVCFKQWPCCRGTHPYIEGVLRFRQEHNLQPGEIDEIRVTVSPLNRMLCEPAENKRQPATAIDAKFSIPFVVGTAFVHGKVALEHFTAEALQDSAVLDVANRVSYAVDDTVGLKESMRGHLEVRTSGLTLSEPVGWSEAEPRPVMSHDLLVQKFHYCAAHAAVPIAPGDLARAVRDILNLESVREVGEIPALLPVPRATTS